MKGLVILCALSAVVHAHFKLNYPPARGFDEDNLPQYPCGGQDNVSPNRTVLPIGSAFPIQLFMGHTQAHVQVVLATGNDPSGADFSTVLVPTLQEDGPQNFCLGAVAVPSSMQNGTNGTIQVITNGDNQGQSGLYNCADVTFTSTPMSPSDFSANCQNSTGVRTEALSQNQAGMNANGTTTGQAPSTTGEAPSTTMSDSGAAATTGSTSGAPGMLAAKSTTGVGAFILAAATLGFMLGL